jgi:cyclopropane fatty-acyl-phospholipid synthase-like methyltransferase
MNIERDAQYPRGARTLEEAPRAKREFVCDKLALGPASARFGGCGRGTFAIHCAATHGTEVVGITLSEPQGASRSTGRRGRASPTGSRSARWITASSPASGRGREHRHG